MKALLYKEFKLSWHPLCYFFPIFFSLLVLIPNYPSYIGLAMVSVTYTILFLGANKGKQTNDLYFSASLPVRKQDILMARFVSKVVMQLMAIAVTAICAPLALLIRNSIPKMPAYYGIDLKNIGVTISFGILCFIITDAFYILMFYKNGRSIIAPSLLSMFITLIFLTIFVILLPEMIPAYKTFFCSKIWVQFICIAISLLIYAISHIFIIKKGIKLINNINL